MLQSLFSRLKRQKTPAANLMAGSFGFGLPMGSAPFEQGKYICPSLALLIPHFFPCRSRQGLFVANACIFWLIQQATICCGSL